MVFDAQYINAIQWNGQELPSIKGNTGKLLTTNGNKLLWTGAISLDSLDVGDPDAPVGGKVDGDVNVQRLLIDGWELVGLTAPANSKIKGKKGTMRVGAKHFYLCINSNDSDGLTDNWLRLEGVLKW